MWVFFVSGLMKLGSKNLYLNKVIPSHYYVLFQIAMANCKIVLYGGKFWWGQQERKVHWITWNHLCKPKGKGCMYVCMYVRVLGVIEVKSCFTFKAG